MSVPYRNTMKRCFHCGIIKPQESFYPSGGNRKDRRGRCKACDSSCRTERRRELQARMVALGDHPEAIEYRKKQRRKANLRCYSITPKKYLILLELQGGRCGICGSSDPKSTRSQNFHVDHDHETGRIRGLLCRVCNFGLGYFNDNLEGLMRAVAYLQKDDVPDLRSKRCPSENG